MIEVSWSLYSAAIAYKLLDGCYEVKDDYIEFDFKYIEDTQGTSDDSDDSPEVRENTFTEDPSQIAEPSVSVEQQ